jgi:hypothetical protein
MFHEKETNHGPVDHHWDENKGLFETCSNSIPTINAACISIEPTSTDSSIIVNVTNKTYDSSNIHFNETNNQISDGIGIDDDTLVAKDSNDFQLHKWKEHISCTVNQKDNGRRCNNKQTILTNETKSNRIHGNTDDLINTTRATLSILLTRSDEMDQCKNNRNTVQQDGACTTKLAAPIVMTGDGRGSGCKEENPNSSPMEQSMLQAYTILIDSSRKYWNNGDIIHRAQLHESPVVITNQTTSNSQNLPISLPSIQSFGRNILGRIATARPRHCPF